LKIPSFLKKKNFKRKAHEYYMEEAKKQAQESNCQESHWGAVLVNQQGKIIGRGFTYIPTEDLFRYCNPCIRKHIRSGTQTEKCSSQHAEVMVFFNALDEYDMSDITYSDMYLYGYSEIEGSPSIPILIQYYPCMHCAKVMLSFKLSKLWMYRPVAKNEAELIYLPKNEGNVKYNLTLNQHYKLDSIEGKQLWYHPSIWLGLAGITIPERPDTFKLGQKYRPPYSRNKVYDYLRAYLGGNYGTLMYEPDEKELPLIAWIIDQVLKDGYFDCSEYEIDFKKKMSMPKLFKPEDLNLDDKIITHEFVNYNFQLRRVRDDVRKSD